MIAVRLDFSQIWGFRYHSVQLQYSTLYPVELYLILVVFRYPVPDLHNSNLHSKSPPLHLAGSAQNDKLKFVDLRSNKI